MVASALLGVAASSTSSAQLSKAAAVTTALELANAQTNGVALAPDGRLCLVIARQKGQDVPQSAESALEGERGCVQAAGCEWARQLKRPSRGC